MVLQGGCLCGAVRYQISGVPFDADYCHCSQCRKSTGAVVMSWMDFHREQVTWLQGQVTEFASSSHIRRGFCQQCGTSMTYRHLDYPEFCTLSIASLDEPQNVTPTYHIYTEEQVSWLKIDDICPRYKAGRTTAKKSD
ncbi:GFA family protein [Shewanella sp. A14]